MNNTKTGLTWTEAKKIIAKKSNMWMRVKFGWSKPQHLSASWLREHWDYKAAGFGNINDAAQAFIDDFGAAIGHRKHRQRRKIRGEKKGAWQDKYGKYAIMQSSLNKLRQHLDEANRMIAALDSVREAEIQLSNKGNLDRGVLNGEKWSIFAKVSETPFWDNGKKGRYARYPKILTSTKLYFVPHAITYDTVRPQIEAIDAGCLVHSYPDTTLSYVAERLAKHKITVERRGHWVERAIIDTLKPRKGKKTALTLTPYHRVKKIDTVDGVKIYTRTLCGFVVDYVAEKDGVTYHANTKDEAINGLIDKSEIKKDPGKAIDYKRCKELGFCDAGIKQFCDDFGLDIGKRYSIKFIRKIVTGKDKAKIYDYELRKAGVLPSEVA